MFEDNKLIDLNFVGINNKEQQSSIIRNFLYKAVNVTIEKDRKIIPIKDKTIKKSFSNIIKLFVFNNKLYVATKYGVYEYESGDLVYNSNLTYFSEVVVGDYLYFSDLYTINLVDKDFNKIENEKSGYTKLPAGKLLLFKGRLYSCKFNMLYFSNPLDYMYMDKTHNYIMFDSNIKDINSLQDSIFILTTTGLFRLVGNSPDDFKLIELPISSNLNTDCLYKINLNMKNIVSNAILFSTTTGLFCCLDSGEIIDISSEFFNIPDNYTLYNCFRSGNLIFLKCKRRDNGILQ